MPNTSSTLVAVLATLFAACVPADDPAASQDTYAVDPPDATAIRQDPEADSSDYSAWFEGISTAEIEDFERDFDADQALFPTELAGPPGESPEPPPAPARIATEAEADGGTPVDAGIDAGTGSIPFDAHVDAGIVDAVIDGTLDASVGVDAACTTGSITVSASATLGAQANVSVPLTYLGTFGPIRQHNIYASGNASVNASMTLSGTLTATPESWTATISLSGAANVNARINAYQELVGLRRQWFSIGDATVSGTATFSDSVTFSKSCSGVLVTTPGTPAMNVTMHIDDAHFYGLFFPRLQGPLVSRVRGAIAQFARNFANRQLPGLIQPVLTSANQQYAAKKNELLDKLRALLPAGCGCP